MCGRIAIAAAAALLGVQATLAAQRPKIGLGIGAGAVLGSELVDHGFVAEVGGREVRRVQQVELTDVAVASAHAEWYVARHVALRVHGAWGAGRLDVNTTDEVAADRTPTAFESDAGDVRVMALDGGISIWPWTPGSVGFAPFITAGIGTYAYDFDDIEDAPIFRAAGRRSERAWLMGIGADMNVWRAVTLRIEAVNHLVDSPLRTTDFAMALDGRGGEFADQVSNVRLVAGAHIYFPFRSAALEGRK